MMKRILISLMMALVGVTVSHASEPVKNYSSMEPTVKVVAYKKSFTDQMVPIGSGSGTVINAEGRILTNYHVVFDENEFVPLDGFEVCITFNVQEEPICDYTAQLIGYDKDLDIALLQLSGEDVYGNSLKSVRFPFLSHRVAQPPKERDSVTVVGYPGSGGDSITISRK
ncbi:trypsin-like peptidase domain-containing protein [Candidatus Peregrinibacteria bacterium]|nr:MAG: trypsin-like peptidase domain-containing protein [Candidatus Peregrinibacteria bacterium]